MAKAVDSWASALDAIEEAQLNIAAVQTYLRAVENTSGTKKYYDWWNLGFARASACHAFQAVVACADAIGGMPKDLKPREAKE